MFVNVHVICASSIHLPQRRQLYNCADNFIAPTSILRRLHARPSTSRGSRSTTGKIDRPAADEDGWARGPFWTHPLQRETEHVGCRHGDGTETNRAKKSGHKRDDYKSIDRRFFLGTAAVPTCRGRHIQKCCLDALFS
jgi:hypothetical protein